MRGATMKRSIAGLAITFFAGLAPHALRAANPPDAPSVILIQNATVLTVSHGTIGHGSILIKDGKIVEVGQSIKAPKDAQIIDAAGQFVMPGIIDCHSHIAVDGSVNEGSVSVSSMANIAEVIDSDDIDIYRDLAGGVTTANILHGSANAIGGQTEVIKLRWGQPAAKLLFEGALPGDGHHPVDEQEKGALEEDPGGVAPAEDVAAVAPGAEEHFVVQNGADHGALIVEGTHAPRKPLAA